MVIVLFVLIQVGLHGDKAFNATPFPPFTTEDACIAAEDACIAAAHELVAKADADKTPDQFGAACERYEIPVPLTI